MGCSLVLLGVLALAGLDPIAVVDHVGKPAFAPAGCLGLVGRGRIREKPVALAVAWGEFHAWPWFQFFRLRVLRLFLAMGRLTFTVGTDARCAPVVVGALSSAYFLVAIVAFRRLQLAGLGDVECLLSAAHHGDAFSSHGSRRLLYFLDLPGARFSASRFRYG